MKLLLFAHGRTGSTTLMHVLNQHPEINLMFEPFNKHTGEYNNSKPKDFEELKILLEEINNSNNGFKHICGQLSHEQEESLLMDSSYFVIYLYRKNLLQRAVSQKLSQQTNIWTASDRNKKREPIKYDRIDIKELNNNIDWVRKERKKNINFFIKSEKPYVILDYDDIFSPYLRNQQKLNKINKILLKIGLEPIKINKYINKLLNPRISKIASSNYYKNIPNYQEIEDKLGNSVNGFLIEKNILIFAFARTGSSTLKSVLDIYPNCKIVGEPFNQNFSKYVKNKSLFRYINNRKYISRIVNQIYSEFRGMKHIDNHLNKMENIELLKNSKHKIVLLWRKNSLAREVSQQISFQTNEWGKNKKNILKHHFDPMDIDQIEREINIYLSRVSFYREFMILNKIDFTEITYEDLYNENISIDNKVKLINSISEYLNLTQVDKEKVTAIKKLLNPDQKLNNKETYLKIPNILDIEKRLGGKDIGSIFGEENKNQVYDQKRILVISPSPSHPQNAGNRARINGMLSSLKDLGFIIHFLLDDQEDGSVHVESGTDEDAMRKSWHYVDVLSNLRVVPFIDLGTMDYYIRKIGKVIRIYFSPIYHLIRPIWKRIRSGRWNIEQDTEQITPIDEWYNFKIDIKINELKSKFMFDIVLVEYVYLSRAFLQFNDNELKIIDTHDVFTHRNIQYEKEGVIESFFSTTKEEEAKGLSRADRIIAIQDEEKKYFNSIVGKPVYTVGHHLDYKKPNCNNNRNKILFIGSANAANIHGINYFINNIYPKVFEKINTDLIVCGKVGEEVQNKEKCQILGEISDNDLILNYQKSDVVIVPTYLGSGLKIKLIEALSYGKPVVTTKLGAAGLTGKMRDAINIGENDEKFGKIILELLKNDSAYNNCLQKIESSLLQYNEQNMNAIKEIFSSKEEL